MIKKKIIATGLSLIVSGLLMAPTLAAHCPGETAPNITPEGQPCLGLGYGAATTLGQQDVRTTIARIINVALGLLGIVAVVIILVGGFEWMTAGGSEEKTGSAKKRITAGIIGLAIILSAYAIATFVIRSLSQATAGQ